MAVSTRTDVPGSRFAHADPAATVRFQTAVVLALAALPRLWAAWFDHGVYWPDEIYQTLEQAHRLVFGPGFVPWEFQDGARSWLIPGFVAALWAPIGWAGLDHPLLLVGVARTAVASLSIAAAWAAMRIGRTAGGMAGGWIAGLLAAFLPLSVMLGSRVTAETVTAALNVFAVLLAMRSGRRPAVAAGVLAALATYLRIQNGLVATGILALIAGRRNRREAEAYVLAGLACAAACGLLDWLTWGAPFHTLVTYLRFQLLIAPRLDGISEPFHAHLLWFWRTTGPAVVPIAAGLALAARRVPLVVLLVAAYVLFHGMVGHKEFRFMMPVLPIAAGAAGAGLASVLDALRNGGRRPLAGAAFGIALAIPMVHRIATATFADYGLYAGTSLGQQSPWHAGEDINLLLVRAGRLPGLCGLAVTAGRNIVQNGGYTYLHRDVPVIGLWNAPEKIAAPAVTGSANHLLMPARVAAPPGYEEVARIGEAALHRREGACSPFPGTLERRFVRPF